MSTTSLRNAAWLALLLFIVLILGKAMAQPVAAPPQPAGTSHPRQPALPEIERDGLQLRQSPLSTESRLPGLGDSAANLAGGEHDAIYQRIYNAIEAGHTDEAHGLLAALDASALQHAGAVLDVAILLCELGERDEAAALFARLQGNIALPPGIRLLIDTYLRSGCVRAGSRPRLQLGAYVGYTNNANFGPRDATVRFAAGAPIPALQLAPSALAQSDRFVGLDANFSVPVAGIEGLSLSGSGAARQYAQRRDYDQVGSGLGIYYGKPTQAGLVEAQLGLGFTWLGQRAYQYGASAQLGYWLPEQHWHWMSYRLGIDTSVALDRYPVSRDFDARRHDLRLKGKLDLSPSVYLFGAISAVGDIARNDRAGGNRVGYGAVASMTWQLHPRHVMVALVQRQDLRDREAYSPFFFGTTRRRQDLRQFTLRYTYQYSRAVSFYSQLVYQRAEDSIPIFRYSAGSLAGGILFDF